jgi:hypothetical protein
MAVEERSPFDLVEATPDPVGFAGPERVVETVRRDGTPPADRLGEPLTGEPHLFPFEVGRREERRGIVAPAGCVELPVEPFPDGSRVVRELDVVLFVAA